MRSCTLHSWYVSTLACQPVLAAASAALALAASSGAGSLAEAAPAAVASTRAGRRLLVIIEGLSGGAGWPGGDVRAVGRAALRRDLAGRDVVVPVRVVLAGPVVADPAVAHGAVRAAHADGADVDVAQEHGHHQH